jgi:hypothetical protein
MAAIYVSLLALHPGVKIGDAPISSTTGTVIDLEQHRDDIASALRKGLVITADKVSASATGSVITGAHVTPTPDEALHVDLSEGSIFDRGAETTVGIPAKAKLALKAADKAKDRTSLVRVKASDGSASVVDGTLADPGQSVAPAVGSGYQPVATVLVKHTWPRPGNPVVITDIAARP